MTIDERILLDKCASILLNNPTKDGLSAVGGALRLLANGYTAHYSDVERIARQQYDVDSEYSQLIQDAKRKGAL
jgi:hypothetical protein